MFRSLLKSVALVVVAQAAVLISFAQDNLIAWPKKLTWDDFKGIADQSSPHYALTWSRVNYTSSIDAIGKITCNVKCSFLTNKSWKKTDKSLTAYLLEHEQIHFNITELYARKLRKALSEYCSTHVNSAATSNEMGAIFNKLLEELYAFHAQYDLETDHSKIAVKQQEWNQKVAAMLKELAPYAQP